ncbi:hypothetical protein K8T06_12970 [bacterium]|nr:hypothetical protein [bacterium]
MENQTLITGKLILGSETNVICRTDNYESMLRRLRRTRRQDNPIHSISALPLFLARYQGLCDPLDNADDFKNCLDQLAGYPLPAELWEHSVLPTRCHGYRERARIILDRYGIVFRWNPWDTVCFRESAENAQ